MTQRVLFVVGLLLSGAVFAQSGDFVIHRQTFDSRVAPDTLSDAVIGAMNNPSYAPILQAGASMLGVPPAAMAALQAEAARQKSEKAASNRGNANTHTYVFERPQGYGICAAQFNLLSIHPREVDRPHVRVTVANDAVVMVVRHQGPQFTEGTSRVKGTVDLLSIKNELASQFESRCFPLVGNVTIFECKGAECDQFMARPGYWHNSR